MTRRIAGIAIPFAAALALGVSAPTVLAQDAGGGEPPAELSQAMRRAAMRNPILTVQTLLNRIAQVERQMAQLRIEVAEAKLAESEAQRELAELRQFIRDNEELADDFEQYQQVRAIAEREQREQERAEARAEMEEAKAERDARRREILAERERERAQAQRLREYREAGFSPLGLGLDVFASRMAFHYDGDVTIPSRFDYEPGFGRYRRFYRPVSTVDYSSMTISGSVLNADEIVRNIGVAVVFFDENGNQVGQHIVQVNNARPNIPYPFTAEIDMALNRPFNSSSTYVLYADAADPDEGSTYETWESSPDSPYARVK